MANQEHLDILKRGVAAWNAWRAENPEIRPALRRAALRRATLRRAAISGADLSGARLIEADLSGADLIEADLSGTRLIEADLSGADLRGADLSGADLSGADLSGANLREVHLRRADLRGADLSGAHLRRADLRETHLSGANLSGANLSGADLSGAHLIRTDLSGANLSGAALSGADLTVASMRAITFADVDLREVRGLETVEHFGPSSIGIDTIYKSGGQIPAAFLRGCGVPDSFIDYIPSLVGALEPIQYHSCFISYSTKDEDFARRLHERMRAKHLRVWFAPEDVQGGQKLYEQIDRAIQFHDRLLLVLSEQSMQSEWVMTEIRRARRQEINEQRRKLFPIRLVDFAALRAWSCFDADHGKDLAVEVREYFIPDFSDWKQHDAFEAAFARLLRDLRAAETTEAR